MYVRIDPEEQDLRLPSGPYDVPLTVQDRILDVRGPDCVPVSGTPGAPAVPEFFGTHMLVNGRVSPYPAVEPRLYRFRAVLNASNGRTFHLLTETDQYVVIDFRGREGRRINLVNYARARRIRLLEHRCRGLHCCFVFGGR
jgi:FtsP/CotA-like multicopper oxidase with cupredoxin domain